MILSFPDWIRRQPSPGDITVVLSYNTVLNLSSHLSFCIFIVFVVMFLVFAVDFAGIITVLNVNPNFTVC